MFNISFEKGSTIVLSTMCLEKYFDKREDKIVMNDSLYCEINEAMFEMNGNHICDCTNATIQFEDQDKTSVVYYSFDLTSDQLIFVKATRDR